MKKSDIIKNGLFYMGSCPVIFKDIKDNQEVINKCISTVAEFTRKAYDNYDSISETGYAKAMEMIVLNNLSENPDWQNIGGKASKDFAGETCIFGENIIDCGIRHAKKYSIFSKDNKNKKESK